MNPAYLAIVARFLNFLPSFPYLSLFFLLPALAIYLVFELGVVEQGPVLPLPNVGIVQPVMTEYKTVAYFVNWSVNPFPVCARVFLTHATFQGHLWKKSSASGPTCG